MYKNFKSIQLYIILISILFTPSFVYCGETINIEAASIAIKARIFTNPSSGEFLVGSTFEMPVYLDTKNSSINTINLKIKFDPTKLSVINSSGGKSIFGIWVEPPYYDNKKGTISLVGIIPGGVVTSSGLITSITFKVIAPGESKVNIQENSSVYLNDGIGSKAILILNSSTFKAIPKTPEGVDIYSETHPNQDNWYMNNSPILSWNSPLGVGGYSVLLDLNPTNIPPSIITTKESYAYYENLNDGVWYLHVRSLVNNRWGNTSHYQIRIDTKAPAIFSPSIDSLIDDNGNKKYLIRFMTTDSLSSIDHYEVGSIENNEENITSPIFIQSESPFLIANNNKKTHVIIRAFDRAGNIREVSFDLYPGITLVMILKKYSLYIFMLLTFILFLELLLHYLFGHHFISNTRKKLGLIMGILKKNSEAIENENLDNNNKDI